MDRVSTNDNLLLKKILTYDDLLAANVGSSSEPLVDVRKYSTSIVAAYEKPDMLPYTGEIIYVRDSVAKKIALVNSDLAKINLGLKIVYGYRHPKVQEEYFYRRRDKLRQEHPELNDDNLDRLTHNFVAVPEVGGHPTGAAVDLTIIDSTGRVLDMGTKIADYTDKSMIRTFAEVSNKQQEYRQLLHDAMVAQGFAPFYGEWWHFSYGDREWAAFYNKKEALYGAIDI